MKWTYAVITALPEKAIQLIQQSCKSNPLAYSGECVIALYKGQDPESAKDWILVTDNGMFYKVNAQYIVWCTDGTSRAIWTKSHLHKVLKAFINELSIPHDPDYQT